MVKMAELGDVANGENYDGNDIYGTVIAVNGDSTTVKWYDGTIERIDNVDPSVYYTAD